MRAELCGEALTAPRDEAMQRWIYLDQFFQGAH